MGDPVHDKGCAHSKDYTYQTACHTDQDGLDQELCQDVDAFCPDTHTEADLACTLRHADVHDIHDPYTAYEERNTRHSRQQHSHHIRSACQHRAQLLLATDGKIIIVTFLQLMVAAEYFRNLVDGLVGVFLLEGRTGNALQMGDGQDLFLNSCVWS